MLGPETGESGEEPLRPTYNAARVNSDRKCAGKKYYKYIQVGAGNSRWKASIRSYIYIHDARMLTSLMLRVTAICHGIKKDFSLLFLICTGSATVKIIICV